MAIPERRHMARFEVHTSLFFHRIKPRSEGEDQAMTINISTGGFTSLQL
jgi:hypothetical protein